MGNMMSAAAYIGIDSCAIEGFDMKKASKFLKEELKIETKEFDISYMVAFGYRQEEPRGKTRQELNDIVRWYN
jgi:nitroreductase